MGKDGFYDKLHVKDLKVNSINVLTNTIDFTIKGSGERIKNLYESLANTNCFSDIYKNFVDSIKDKFNNGFPKIYNVNNIPKIPEDCYTYVTDEFGNLLVCRNTKQGMKFYKLFEYEPSTETALSIDEGDYVKLTIKQNS